MKIIADAGSEQEKEARFDSIFDRLRLPPREWSRKASGERRYVSFSTAVTIESREQLQQLYAELQALPEVRYVL